MRANGFVKNLKRFRKQLEREAGKLEATKCAFVAETFKMPSEYHLFGEEFSKNPGIAWIMKPSSSGEEAEAGGRAFPCESAVGHKYILLEAWLSRGGLVHFSNTRFTLNGRDDRSVLPVCVCRKEGWLLEASASPPLTAGSQEDCEFKRRLLKDTARCGEESGRVKMFIAF
ncbi:putative tubulin polyglutamylase TTLL9 [Chlamydotis macqueenii]